MTEYVQLPIFDEDGMDTGRALKINTNVFKSRFFAGAVKEVDSVDVNEEMEVVNRIIHGEPPRPTKGEVWTKIRNQMLRDSGKDPKSALVVNHGRLEMVSFVSEEEGIGEVTLVDGVSPHPNDWIVDALADTSRTNPWQNYNNELRDISAPGYTKYAINRRGQVFLKETKESVSIEKGTKYNTVLLVNDDGSTRRMVVEFLVKNAFPELAK